MAATINKKAKIIEQLYKTNSVDSEHLELFLTWVTKFINN